MARLRAEHHPEGPGDAPRRKRSRKSSPSVDFSSSASQTRATSPEVELRQAKRTKRVQYDDSDQLIHELSESVARSRDDTIHVADDVAIRRARRHSEPLVGVPDDDDDDDVDELFDADRTPPATQPLPGLTPHLKRVGAPRGRPTNKARRARMSMPAQLHLEAVEDEGGSQFQFAPLSAVLDSRTRRRLRRSHLSEEVNDLESHQKEDKKLRKAYAELHRQLREKDKLVNDLKFQLEAKRLGDIDISDDHAHELEQELEQAKKEIDELRASSVYAPGSPDQMAFDGAADAFDDDDDELMLIQPDELDEDPNEDIEPPTPGIYARRAVELSSQVTRDSLSSISQTMLDSLANSQRTDPGSIPDKISDKAIKRYEAEIEHLTMQLAESQGALRVVVIELQNLHVLEPGASTDLIMEKLRLGLETLRNEIETLVPGTTEGLTNSELLFKAPELLQGVLLELNETVLASEHHRKNERILRTQYEHVIDLLARSEETNDQLHQQIGDLEDDANQKSEVIAELEEHVAGLNNTADQQDNAIQEKDSSIQQLEEDIANKDVAVTRYRDALKAVEDELDAVSKTLTHMEEEHRVTLAQLESDHADTVQKLTAHLNAENEGRLNAEEDAEQKSAYIDELETRINGLDTEVGTIADQLAILRERLEDETAIREKTEDERDEQSNLAYEHANTIENLKENIDSLQGQIEEYRNNLAAEREQRELTETELNAANDEIAELNDRLHDAGIQANELRSKLFAVQQEKEETIAQLREEKEAQEEELEGLLADETEQREQAEQNIANLEQRCTQLFEDLNVADAKVDELTRSLHKVEKARDESVASLKTQLGELHNQYMALENNSRSEITTLSANIADLNNEVMNYKAEVERLRQLADDNEQAFEEEKAAMSARIEDLESDLSASQQDNEAKAERIKRLERRVEEEATELLNVMGAHTKEIDTLQSIIANQDASIRDLEATAKLRAAEHNQAITAKEAEIEDLRITADLRVEDIVALEAQIEEMKEHFRSQEEDTRATIDTLMESQRRLQEQNEQLAGALKKRNADALKAVQDMKYKGVEIKGNSVDLRRVVHGKVGKISEKIRIGKKKGGSKKVSKRQWDSGIGVDDNFEAEDDELALDEGVAA
ncbi:hypothetical protein BS50DRAFT_571327 [Corynespora cassiicola Philippines]|uniref:Uncharacterized protein n=1 Tax=Corynespora cassiicola Philippines TaxID=1448308 RepID=A0A2T2NX67_CORCC|nr:hypothetical protein BS50DRAFT_571327 [Corynespora cassiicola Philippines]